MKPRNIVVTGTSSGIGNALALRLLDSGHHVLGVSRRPANIEHENFLAASIDLSADDAGTRLTTLAKEHKYIDALISNAGGGQFGSLENFSAAQIQQSINQNLTSHLLVARAFIPTLKKQPRSNIIFMGSEAALTGSRQGSVYCAAKFGLRGFAQALREECANQNTHIGIINPGMVRTPFFEAQPFEPGPSVNNALHVDDVVDAVMLMFNANDNAVIDEINLSPLTHVVNKKPPLLSE